MSGGEATLIAATMSISVIVSGAVLKMTSKMGGHDQTLTELVATTKELSLTSRAQESRLQRLEDERDWTRRNKAYIRSQKDAPDDN